MAIPIDVNSPSPKALAGRTAVVTGGSSGIGLATAKLMHSVGCNVVLGDLRPPKQYTDDPVFSSKKIYYQHCDVTSWKSVKALYEKTIELFGSIDIVSANAGVNEDANSFFSTNELNTDEPNLSLIDVNIKGTFYTALLAMQYMKTNQQGGSIVITASMAGYFPQYGLPLYTASKFALIGFMRVMAVDCLPHGISVSCVAPGLTETPMIKTLLEKDEVTTAPLEDRLRMFFRRLEGAGIPAQSPEVVAKSILHLAQQGASGAGNSLYVQGSEVIELENELRKNMPKWLDERMRYSYPDASTWAKLSGARSGSVTVRGKL